MVIYKITNPKGRIYIGQAANIKRRISRYKCGDCKNQRLLYNSILKYTWNAHKIEIIYNFEGDKNKANDIEIKFIKFFNSYYYENNKFGLNLTKGGANTTHLKEKEFVDLVQKTRKGYTHSLETRKKISNSNKGIISWAKDKKFTEDHRKKISESRKKLLKIKPIVHSEETRKKLSEAMKGKVFTEEHKANISKAAKNRKNKKLI